MGRKEAFYEQRHLARRDFDRMGQEVRRLERRIESQKRRLGKLQLRERRLTFQKHKDLSDVNAYRVHQNQHRQRDLEERIKLDVSQKDRLLDDMEALSDFVNAVPVAAKLSYRRGLLLDKANFRDEREPEGEVPNVDFEPFRDRKAKKEEKKGKKAHRRSRGPSQDKRVLSAGPDQGATGRTRESQGEAATLPALEPIGSTLRSRRVAPNPMLRFFEDDDPPGRDYKPNLTALEPPMWATEDEWSEWRGNIETVHGLIIPKDAGIPRTQDKPFKQNLPVRIDLELIPDEPPAVATDRQWQQWLEIWHRSRSAKQHASAQEQRAASEGITGLVARHTLNPFRRKKQEKPPAWARLAPRKEKRKP